MKNLNNIKKLALTLLISGLFVCAGYAEPSREDVNLALKNNNFQYAFEMALSNHYLDMAHEILRKYKNKIIINKLHYFILNHKNRYFHPLSTKIVNGYLLKKYKYYYPFGPNSHTKYIDAIKILVDNGLDKEWIKQAIKQIKDHFDENEIEKPLEEDEMYKYLTEELKKPLKMAPRAERYHDISVYTK